ncbi:hypothetical protein Hanom_Chr01g00068731 [Helianthus anomalus]
MNAQTQGTRLSWEEENRERNTHIQEARLSWEEDLDRQLADFHMLANTATDLNLNQVVEPELLPLFPNQPMEVEQNRRTNSQSQHLTPMRSL